MGISGLRFFERGSPRLAQVQGGKLEEHATGRHSLGVKSGVAVEGGLAQGGKQRRVRLSYNMLAKVWLSNPAKV